MTCFKILRDYRRAAHTLTDTASGIANLHNIMPYARHATAARYRAASTTATPSTAPSERRSNTPWPG